MSKRRDFYSALSHLAQDERLLGQILEVAKALLTGDEHRVRQIETVVMARWTVTEVLGPYLAGLSR